MDSIVLKNCQMDTLSQLGWLKSSKYSFQHKILCSQNDLPRESRLEALSGLRLSLRARLSLSSPSPGPEVGDRAGCDSRLFPSGGHDSSKAVACRCNRCNRGRSGLARESRRFTRPHCVVLSRRPDDGAVGLVAGGVTELVTIVGGGSA